MAATWLGEGRNRVTLPPHRELICPLSFPPHPHAQQPQSRSFAQVQAHPRRTHRKREPERKRPREQHPAGGQQEIDRMAVRAQYEGSNEIGVFTKLTNTYCLVAIDGSENFYRCEARERRGGGGYDEKERERERLGPSTLFVFHGHCARYEGQCEAHSPVRTARRICRRKEREREREREARERRVSPEGATACSFFPVPRLALRCSRDCVRRRCGSARTACCCSCRRS